MWLQMLGVGLVEVIGLNGLSESKDRPSTTYALGKYIPHFGSVVRVSMGTKYKNKNFVPASQLIFDNESLLGNMIQKGTKTAVIFQGFTNFFTIYGNLLHIYTFLYELTKSLYIVPLCCKLTVVGVHCAA